MVFCDVLTQNTMFIHYYLKEYLLQQILFFTNKNKKGDINLTQRGSVAFFLYSARAPPKRLSQKKLYKGESLHEVNL